MSERGPGEGLSAPPPRLHPRTFIGSHPPLEPQTVNHFSLLSSAVLRWKRSKPGVSGTLSAVERDGASAASLDRRIGRDVPAHLHPTRDRRSAAEAGQPGRRRKCFNGIVLRNKGTSPSLIQFCLYNTDTYLIFKLIIASIHTFLMRLSGVIIQFEVLQVNG